jgi:dihydroorotase-like cyclic amidohydrolase
MKKLAIRGGHVITPIEERLTDVIIEGGAVSALGKVTSGDDLEIIEASGCWVTPGLIDLQVNGGPECDFWADPGSDQVQKFANSLVKAGVTTILPTLITDDLDHLCKNLEFLENTIQVSERQLEPAWTSRANRSPRKARNKLQHRQKHCRCGCRAFIWKVPVSRRSDQAFIRRSTCSL